ncbi:MAG: alpha-amylase/4-alpha-glucanotransferase domain-containing protein [Planctomycetota bacterium]
MSDKLQFVIALHSHQPVGNFDHVFEHAHEKCYGPILDVWEKYPEIKLNLHFSGVLLEWIEAHHPETFDRLKRMVASGQLELVGGGMYEPILVMLPDEDRHGQIVMQSDYHEKHFGQRPTGIWLTERVWEQGLVAAIADAGIDYTTVDDSHVKFAGFSGSTFCGYFMTEDRGRTLAVFPMDEFLRYAIPFKSVEENIGYLRSLHDDPGASVVTYGDDGEKFGIWPGTFKHCYEDGWLYRFLDALRDNRQWLETVTFKQARETTDPLGKIYIPDASYREMMEWALPTDTHIKHTEYLHRVKDAELYDDGRFFIKGTVWRQFQTRYAEAAEMYARMMHVSKRLADLGKAPRKLREAIRRELYQGQCNCPYWHGVFGGLYLAHLRFAIYKHLVAADNLIDDHLHAEGPYLDVIEDDFDFDGLPEVALANRHLKAFFKPDRGGHLVELDVRPIATNATATLTRTREEYHHRMLQSDGGDGHDDGAPKSIHESIVLKDPELRSKVIFDPYKRESLIDHILTEEVGFEDLKQCRFAELADFVTGRYRAETDTDDVVATLKLTRDGTVQLPEGGFPIRLEKTIALKADAEGLVVDYHLVNNGSDRLVCRFAVENHVALLAGDAPDRYFWNEDTRTNLGPLVSELKLESVRCFDTVDEWQRLRMRQRTSVPARIWTFPVQTVSQSEGGIELTYQGSVVLSSWPIDLDPGEGWTVTMHLDAVVMD